jgi:CBS domain containing-hemolysin-like protein
MTDTPYSRPPRTTGAENESSLGGLFRSWLRAALGGKSNGDWRETIEELIEEDDAGADFARHERRLLANILRLKDTKAIDAMVPRADIVAVEIDTPLEDVIKIFSEKAHSRLPVYRETLDDPVGIVHIRDAVAALAGEAPSALAELKRDALIVAPSMPVLDLLLEMRARRQQLALVVDEYGGIDGLVTIEDIVEEIVGEIQDEHEGEEDVQIQEGPDGSFLTDARLPIEDFEERVGPVLEDDERDDIDTVGGMVFSLAGRVPARGEILRHPAGLEIEVVDADPRRIRRVRVRRLPAEEPGRSEQPQASQRA